MDTKLSFHLLEQQEWKHMGTGLYEKDCQFYINSEDRDF